MGADLSQNGPGTTAGGVQFHGNISATRLENCQHRHHQFRRTLHCHRHAPTRLQAFGNQPITQRISLRVQFFITDPSSVMDEGDGTRCSPRLRFKQLLHAGMRGKVRGRLIPFHHNPFAFRM